MENSNNTPNQNRASFDPGWNDPPTLSYNAQQTPDKPRKLLNKRVPFPMTSTDNVSSSTTPTSNILPPMPSSGILTPNSTSQSTIHDNNNKDQNFDSDNILSDVKRILLEFLSNSKELGAKSNSIQKRISTMEEMWLSGKINRTVQVQMKELAYALQDDKPDVADDIHKALMVDHISVVSTWMPGIKQLVHHCRAKSELMAIDKFYNNTD